MKTNRTELVMILDRSGSMAGLEDDTIGGYNSMLERQKKGAGEVTVTTVLFDDQYELLHDRIPLNDIVPITREEYFVRGCTALLDAIGKTIHKIANAQRHIAAEKRADKVLFAIITDGRRTPAGNTAMPSCARWWSGKRSNTAGNFCSWAQTSTPSPRPAALASRQTARRTTTPTAAVPS